jgi:hypothetical protein
VEDAVDPHVGHTLLGRGRDHVEVKALAAPHQRSEHRDLA